ncbi:MAG: hypothetical protein Q9217_001830 [Psora testacea]
MKLDLPQFDLTSSAYESKTAFEHYIPVGSFVISGSAEQAWVPIDHRNISLLGRKCPLEPLIKADWARAFTCGHASCVQVSLVRVYVLPDDVGRRYIERDDRILQKRLQELMGILDVSLDAWEGKTPPGVPTQRYKTDSDDDDSLFYLFNTVPSPDPEALSVTCATSQHAIDSVFEPEALPGLKATLYPYQKRTAATMIRREVQPRRSLDPRLSPTKGPLGHDFYHDCQTGQIFLNRKEYDEVKGGVLAESMGLGKTLISLATILATKGHWPSIPPEYSLGLHPVRPATGSLMQMAAAAVGREQIPWRTVFQELSRSGETHGAYLSALEENIGSYHIPPPPRRHSRRPSTMPEPQKIRLCSATIIIVPRNLLTQWQHEVAQHFTQGTFKVLCIDVKDGAAMPKASLLMLHDIILITRQRFEQELCSAGSKGVSGASCICLPHTQCHCPANIDYESPLRELHFLRVIMDEGHEFAGRRRNNAYHALARLRVDRKWIVSGTPASGLLGVEVGSAAYGTLERTDVTNAELLEKRKHETGFQQELKDLNSLRIIVTGFLDMKPWSNGKHEDPANWSQYITPYNDGRRKPTSLRNLLDGLVVRHRIEDVESDVQLPPLYNRIVHLEPSWQDRLSQNAFIIALIVNAVTSERVDEDYMFHPKNRPALHQLINNLRQSGFYWTSFEPEELLKTLQLCRQYLEARSGPGPACPESDRLLLRQANAAGEIILASPSWKVFSELHEMGMFVDDFPLECRDAWTLIPRKDSGPTLIGATQLGKAQKWVDSHLYEGPQLLRGLASIGETAMEKAWKDLHRTQEAEASEESPTEALTVNRRSPKEPAKKRKKTKASVAGQPKLTEHFTVSKARLGPGTPIAKTNTNAKTGAKGETPSNSQPLLKSVLKTSKSVTSLDADSGLAKTTLRGTASAKLSYLLSRVTALHTTEKILIFYEGDHIAYYIAHAFDLIDIRYLIYTRTLDLALKSAYVATFNSTSTFRVMLMNIHEAAHGLHIASASRVFFVNPVWQPNVEAQAIKRAHRIGQSLPVYVETLVLKDTLEDQMLQRRKGMTAQEHQRAEKSLLDDEPMSAIIKDARLLPLQIDQNQQVEKQLAKLETPIKLFGRAGNCEIDPGNPYADLIFPIETNKTKKLGIKKTTQAKLEAMQSKPSTGNERKRDFDLPDEGETSINGCDIFGSPPPTKRRVGFAINDGKAVSLCPPQIGLNFANLENGGFSDTTGQVYSTRPVDSDLGDCSNAAGPSTSNIHSSGRTGRRVNFAFGGHSTEGSTNVFS